MTTATTSGSGGPPFSGNWIKSRPDRCDTRAMRLPSGETAGLPSVSFPAVSWVSVSRAVSTTSRRALPPCRGEPLMTMRRLSGIQPNEKPHATYGASASTWRWSRLTICMRSLVDTRD